MVAWLGLAGTAITVLAFFGISNFEELQQALDEESAGSRSADSAAGASGGAGDGEYGGAYSSSGADGGVGDESSSGGVDDDEATVAGGDSGYTEAPPSPTPEPDPTLDAFRAVSAGDCLHTWMVSGDRWSSDIPEIISCEADGAAVYVTRVSDSAGSCPVDAGRSYLSYRGEEETAVLCVTRLFEAGQCFLGSPGNSANLMSWVDCEATRVPQPYDRIFNVTGYYNSSYGTGAAVCRRVAGDTTRYLSWVVDQGAAVLCAVVYRS
ncbi:hypothetical protein RM780_05455 [Streptomyces sp. DSM 44917]|uniref:Uncharacterized protein n=1 Tax=Streptomyces boetiae TaxID=3075541 RepID=A0ABU2L4C8_9ACTN|nr:hypothetical protein [Streptomyces sp. DSM 44917]MDT0306408.1 hypothetical protein [Streptomyces sp. DSM 44917]